MRAFLTPLLLCLLAACTTTGATIGTSPAAPAEAPTGYRPQLPSDRPLRAGFLVVDGVYNSELMAPYDILHHTIFHTEPGIEPVVISPDGRPVTSFEGLTIVPHHGFADAPPLDILVVPSAEHSMDSDLENEELIRWVRETGEQALYVISLCDGAFVLAQAGLLDGHAATTFPADQPAFAERFPNVDLRINVSFVASGKMLTSVGGAKSYDVAMWLVDHLYGTEVAQGVGRGMVITWPPELGEEPAWVTDEPEGPAATDIMGEGEPSP
jgi:transcriptional regulator GlxA family with amidase domain